METAKFETRKEKVTIVANRRGRLNAWIILLMFCFSLFSSDAMALYSIFETGTSDVYGISDAGSLVLDGAEFGSVIVIADDARAYGIYSSDANITIDGLFDTVGIITATVSTNDDAFALFAPDGSIYTDGLDGTINAQAEDSWAIGLYSPFGDVNTADINGTISSQTGNTWAVGLFGDNINTGDIDGVINAVASNSDAYGLYSGGVASIHTGDINGTITATANSRYAAGLRATGGSVYTGDINGTITATAVDEYAWGLYSSEALSIHVGDVNGTISANVNSGSHAYGMYSTSSITTGDILGDALISATASDNYAYGLFSDGGESIYTGDIDGTITATAGGDDAGGLVSTNSSVTTGNINGTISATASGAGNDTAYGIYGYGSVTIGDVNGVISAEMTNGTGAYAIRSETDITTGDIFSDAVISGMAELGEAYGLFSGGGTSINTGDVNGVIIADANNGDYAAGMYSSSTITTDDFGVDAAVTATAAGSYASGLTAPGIETGALNGTITVTADANRATGLVAMGLETGPIGGTITVVADVNYAYGLSAISMETGPISGTVSATAGNNFAVGLSATGSSSLTTGAISGTIDANTVGDFAYGILSYGAMDVNVVGGTVRAVANDGNNVAAIQSGLISSGALVTQDANDTVGISAGSTIVGDIDLAQSGTDNDVLILWGTDSNSPGSTTFTDDVNNVETINVTGGTFYVNGTIANSTNGVTVYDGVLGGSGDILCDLHVMGGIFAPGNSIDTVHIGGDWTHDPNGIYEVEVDNNELADLTIVDGMTTLDGTIRGRVYGDRIDHTFSSPVLVIDSNELSGIFADVNGVTRFPIFSVTYDTNDVYLGVLFDYGYYARTCNQHSVGRAFNQIVSSGRDTGDMNDVLTAVETQSDGDAVNEAYNQLMPQDMLGLPDVIRRIMGTHNDGIMEHMDNRRRAGQYTMLENNRYLLADAAGSMALLSETGEWMPFIKGIGMWADRDSERDIAGYKYKVYGAIAGMDKQVSDSSIMGFSIGGLKTSVDYTRGSTKADIDSLLLALHGSCFGDDWHLDYTAGYGRSWYDQQRGIAFLNRTAKSEHTSNAFTFEVEYGQNLSSYSILEPVAGMGYTLVQEDGYTESNAGAANLKVDSENYDGFYTKLGIQTTTEVTFENNPDLVMVPKLSAFWVHDFADRVEVSSSFVGGGSFKQKDWIPWMICLISAQD